MKKNNLKKFFIAICFGIIVSCSSVGVRTVPDSAVVSRDTIVENSITEIKEKFGEDVKAQDVGIYKKGFRDWKVILYGKNAYYQVQVAEDGKIVESKVLKYK